MMTIRSSKNNFPILYMQYIIINLLYVFPHFKKSNQINYCRARQTIIWVQKTLANYRKRNYSLYFVIYHSHILIYIYILLTEISYL